MYSVDEVSLTLRQTDDLIHLRSRQTRVADRSVGDPETEKNPEYFKAVIEKDGAYLKDLEITLWRVIPRLRSPAWYQYVSYCSPSLRYQDRYEYW